MATFRVFAKGVWKGPFPEEALIAKFNAGGIPLGTRVQESATGGEMLIEELAAGATMVDDKPLQFVDASAKSSTRKLPSKLTAAERNAPTQKISNPRPAPAKPAPVQPARPAPSQPAKPNEPAKKPLTKGPLAKMPQRAGSRHAQQAATAGQGSRGINWIFVLSCLLLAGSFGGSWMQFEGAMADGGDLVLMGFSLPAQLTLRASELAWKPPAEIVWAAHSLFLLYLIPAIALLALIHEFVSARGGKNRWWARILVALAAPGIFAGIAALMYSGLAAGIAGASSVVEPIGSAATFGEFLQASFETGKGHTTFGLWALAGGVVLCLLSVLTCPRRKPEPAPTKPATPGAEGPAVND